MNLAGLLGRIVLSLGFAGTTGLFAAAFYERYWKWRACFAENEHGRCFDAASEEVFLEQAGLLWGSLSVVFALLTAASLARLLQARSARQPRH